MTKPGHMTGFLIAAALLSSCVVEGRCVVEVAPPAGKGEAVQVKVSDAGLINPKEAAGTLDALTTIGGAALKAVLTLL